MTFAGHTTPTAIADAEERAHRERRLAAILESEGDGSDAIAQRIAQHHQRAADYDAAAKQARGWA